MKKTLLAPSIPPASNGNLSLEKQEELFDQLAGEYDLLLQDWRGYQDELSRVLDQLFKNYGNGPVNSILDLTCGIGTQCIGLARLGYKVKGLDISEKSISRAQQESAKAGFDIEFDQGDIRVLDDRLVGAFDAVISCDNSLPALLSQKDLNKGLENIFRALTPEGICIASIRNYDQILAEKKRLHPRQVHEIDGKRTIIFDLWDYENDQFVIFTVFFLQEGASGWDVRTRRMVYRSIYQEDMIQALIETGFTNVERIDRLGENDLNFDYYIARKPKFF